MDESKNKINVKYRLKKIRAVLRTILILVVAVAVLILLSQVDEFIEWINEAENAVTRCFQ